MITVVYSGTEFGLTKMNFYIPSFLEYILYIYYILE